jgi:hypothetical protein
MSGMRHPEPEPFEVEAIVAEAERRTGGLDDLGDGPFLEPLALFLESLEGEARLNELGRLIARERALLHTVNRLNHVNDRRQFPAIADDEAMCTPLFHNQFRVPTYEDWVDRDADWSHVYTFHHKQLQHLQWRNHRDRWVLKTGAHMWGLKHLLLTYPDARIVFTHRDPVKSVTSYASLTTLVREMGSDDVDPFEVAQDWTARLQRVLEHVMQVRNATSYPNAMFYDMQFSDFVADQFAVISDIYASFRLPMTAGAAARMRAFIADNPKGKHGVHSYTPEEFGVDPGTIRRDFAPYIEQFGLAPE